MANSINACIQRLRSPLYESVVHGKREGNQHGSDYLSMCALCEAERTVQDYLAHPMSIDSLFRHGADRVEEPKNG
jgi:hypothetical protein